MRIGLRDDFGLHRCAPTRGAFSLPVGLDEDLPGGSCGCGCSSPGGPGEPPSPEMPTAVIRQRTKLYFDGDGTPSYSWADVGSGPVVLIEERTELNDATGQTQVLANAEVSWADGLPVPPETSTAWIGGVRYEVKSCVPLPGRLRLLLERLDDVE